MSGLLLREFFLSGLVLGTTTCSLLCGAALAPFVLDGTLAPVQALKRVLLFHAGKLAAYVVLGGLVGASAGLLGTLRENRVLLAAGGAFFLLLGVVYLVLPDERMKRLMHVPVVGAGVMLGFLPCGPLAGFLVYLAYVANTAWKGCLGGCMFGLGSMLNPLLLLAPLFPSAGARLGTLCRRPLYLKLLYGGVFFFWAANLFRRSLV
jgi:sulfite exporter TauE/SafE